MESSAEERGSKDRTAGAVKDRKLKTASGSGSECAANTYPAKLVGALHTAHLYVPILSSGDNLHTLKVTGQDHHITTGAIGLQTQTIF